jgi:predicted DNA-binding antitoxin AbrB/MazE fold protein
MQSLLWAHAPEHPTCILAPIEVELDRDQEVEMADETTAIYEQGVLRLLTPITLPEHTRVRVQILTKKESRDDLHRAEAALLAAGLVRLPPAAPSIVHVSKARRAELSHLYVTGDPLSVVIIPECDTR